MIDVKHPLVLADLLTCSISSSGTLAAGINGREPKMIPVRPRAVRMICCRPTGYLAWNCGKRSTWPGGGALVTAPAALCATREGFEEWTKFSATRRSKFAVRWIEWRDWGRIVWGGRCLDLLDRQHLEPDSNRDSILVTFSSFPSVSVRFDRLEYGTRHDKYGHPRTPHWLSPHPTTGVNTHFQQES